MTGETSLFSNSRSARIGGEKEVPEHLFEQASGVADPGERTDVPDITVPAGAESYPLRKPCPCSSGEGYIREQNGQQVVYCTRCHRYQYCAPKSETGLPQRSVSTRPVLKPKHRARILERDSGRCVVCGRGEGNMHIGHLLSVEDGRKLGASDDEIWSDENLAVMCEECNLGFGKQTVALRLVYRVLQIRMAQKE